MALTDIQEQLKQLQQEEERLAERKNQLEKEMKRQAELDKKLDELVKKSGFENARDLVKALVLKYNLRLRGIRDTGAQEKTGRRKRTRITPDVRDMVKREVNENGSSMNAASKKFGISYAVISKIIKGHYDNKN